MEQEEKLDNKVKTVREITHQLTGCMNEGDVRLL